MTRTLAGCAFVLLFLGALAATPARADTVLVHGMVRDTEASPGNPLPGITVYLWRHDGWSVRISTASGGIALGYYQQPVLYDADNYLFNLVANKADQPGYNPAYGTLELDNIDARDFHDHDGLPYVDVNFDIHKLMSGGGPVGPAPAFPLFAIHDPGGEGLMAAAGKPGWIVFTEAVGADPKDQGGRDYTAWSSKGYRVIARLNHGYGSAGTIPKPAKYADFAQRVANFISHSAGCSRFIIGNEPNLAAERPGGEPIPPQKYVECFNLCADAVHGRKSIVELIPAAVGNWNFQTGDYVDYFKYLATWCKADGLALHTYTHGAAAALVTSTATSVFNYQDLDGKWQTTGQRYYHFWSYRDFLVVVPEARRGLPVYLTEADQDVPWDVSPGNRWVTQAYAEIKAWNADPAHQKVHCLALYRWAPDDPQWDFSKNGGVQEDFLHALSQP